MARKTVTVQLPEDAVAREGETYDGETQTPAEADADQLRREESDDVLTKLSALDAGGNSVRWQVNRVNQPDPGYLFDLQTSELTLQNIKLRAGPGKYRVTGFRENGQYAGSRTFSIAKESTPVPGTSLVPVGPQKIEDYLQFIERSRLAQKEELKFWAGLLTPLAAILLPLMFQRKESGIAEMVTAIKSLKGMTDSEDSLAQLTKTKQLIGMLKDLVPEKDATGSTWPDIIRDVVGGIGQAAPQLVSALAARRAAQPAAPASVMAGIPPENIAPSEAPQNEQGDPMLQLIAWLQAQIPGLIIKAAKNSDPAAYAYVMVDNMPPGTDLTGIYQFLHRPDWWTMLQSVNPNVRPYERWFTDLHDELIEVIEEAVPSLKPPRQPRGVKMSPPDDQTPGEAP